LPYSAASLSGASHKKGVRLYFTRVSLLVGEEKKKTSVKTKVKNFKNRSLSFLKKKPKTGEEEAEAPQPEADASVVAEEETAKAETKEEESAPAEVVVWQKALLFSVIHVLFVCFR